MQANPLLMQTNIDNQQFIPRPAVKLPTIELPKFDENYELWMPFKDLFESLIASNNAIPPVQKLHYLRSALSGEAAKVITALEITNDNYEIAWNSLRQRFENKKLLTHHLIQTLIELPVIARESHADLRQLADNVTQITQNLVKLGQPTEHFAIWVIHIILPKIDKSSRREWEFERSNMEEFSSLDEFTNFLISHSACLEAVSRASRNAQIPTDIRNNNKGIQGQNKNTTRAFVTSDNSCFICSSNHKMHECSSFLNMSVVDRNAEARKKRLCIKCLKPYHGKNCKVSNCQICKGYHNTLLHKNKPSTEANDKKSNLSSIENSTKSNNANNTKQQSLVALGTESPSPTTSLNHCATKGPPQVLLSTAILFI